MGEDFLLTHIPVHDGQFERWKYNIHGHTHTNALPDKRYIYVSAEQIGLTPISLAELRAKINSTSGGNPE